MSQERIRAKLLKLLALARHGVGGEKENAASVLDKLLKKYCLTLEDLDDANAERQIYWIKASGKSETTLLSQCVAATVPGWDRATYRHRGVRGVTGYALTHAEHMQIDLMFEIHRRALKKHVEKQRKLAVLSYIQTNEIFPAASDDAPAKPSKLSEEDVMQIISMMRGMEPTPVHKAIAVAKGGGA